MIYASRYLFYTEPAMRGPDVLELQSLLQQSGFCPGSPDAVFGPRTREALRLFQKAHGRPSDGIAGPDTWLLLSSLAQADASAGAAPLQAPLAMPSITVDVTRRQLYFDSAELQKTFPVAVGKPKTPTPLGNWTIVQKAENPGGPFGARWMRLSVPWGGYGIHGTNNPKSIGKAASHGCIRMYNKDVIEIYPLVPIGTPVAIVGKNKTSGTLEMNMKGPEVRLAQRQLKVLGYRPGPVDGVFGEKTREAVSRMQKAHQLAVTGKLDYQSLLVLEKEYAKNQENEEP